MRLIPAFAAIVGAIAALPSMASAQSAITYASESAFDAATTTTQTIDFNSYPSSYQGRSFNDGGVSFVTNATLFTQDNNAYGTGAFLTAQGAPATSVAITFASAITAVGFSYQSGTSLSIYITDPSTELVGTYGGTTYPTLGFAGFTDSTPFQSIIIADAGAGIDLDNIKIASISSVSAVPETATWAMMILGVGAIGGMMRRAYRKSEEKFTAKVRATAAG